MEILQLITAFFGSLGFSLVYRLRKNLLIYASFGGMMSWGIYLIGYSLTQNDFTSCLVAAFIAGIYSEVIARVKKAPATLLLIPSIIPLIPGSSLFNMMSSVVNSYWMRVRIYGRTTYRFALAIALGVSLVWALHFVVEKIGDEIKNKSRS